MTVKNNGELSGASKIWAEIKANRNAYIMAFWGAMGGMYFGWDSGLIGGVLSEPSFKRSFGLDTASSKGKLASLQGNIVSVLQAGCFFGAAASLYFPDRYGRKPSLIGATCIFLIGSLIQATCKLGGQTTAAGLNQLYIGRFIGGFGVGFSSAVVPTYISECAPREIRGRLAGMYQLLNVTGIMLSFWVNYGLQANTPHAATNDAVWRTAFFLQIIPGVFMVAGILTQPESPRWLVEMGRYDEAADSLRRLRVNVKVEDEVVQTTLREIIIDKEARTKLSLWGQAKATCKDRKTFYRVFIAIIVMFFQQWTGTNSINIYSPQIFQGLGITGTNTGLFATGVYGCVKVICTSIGLMFAMEQAGRKISLITGGTIQAIAMFYIGAYSKLHPTGPKDAGSYVAIVMVYIFVVGYSFGWGSVPWAVMAECAPTHLRSLAMALGLMTNWLFNFTIAKITPTLLEEIKYGTFLIFGSCSVIMVIWAAIALPETRGLSLESVHTVFEGSIIQRSIADLRPSRQRELLAKIDAQREEQINAAQGVGVYGAGRGNGSTTSLGSELSGKVDDRRIENSV